MGPVVIMYIANYYFEPTGFAVANPFFYLHSRLCVSFISMCILWSSFYMGNMHVANFALAGKKFLLLFQNEF